MKLIRRSISIAEDGGRIFREISECQDHCSGCPLEGKQDPVGPIGVARGKSQYAFVTGVPFTNEHGGDGISLLRPPAWSLLRKSLEKNDIRWDRKDYAVVPSVRCSFDAKNTPNKEIKNIQNHCVGWLEQDLSEIKPSVIVPLGAVAASQVMGRVVKITKARGVLAKRNDGTNVFPTIDPTSCIAYPQNTPVFVADIETFRRLLDNSMDQEAASSTSLVEYEVVHDLRFILQDNPPILSFDTETTSLSWFKKGEDPRKFRRGVTPDDFVARAAVLTMQFSYEAGKAYVLPWDHPDDPMSYKDKPRILAQLQRVLSKSKIITQNGKFDRVYLRNVVGVDFPIAGDTFMLATLLDENALERNLDILMKLYVPEMAGYNDYYNSIINKEKMWAEPLERIVVYGAGDSDAVFRLHQVLYRKVAEDPRLLDHYKHVTLPGLNALSYMESRGSYIDESKLEKFEQDTTKYVNELEQHLLAQVPDSIKRAHIDKGLKFSRPDFKLDILFRHPDGFRLKPQVFTKGSQGLFPKERVPSTSSKDHLPFFFDECSFAEDLAIYIKAERMLNTDVIGFKKKYIVDGMVRPSYSLGTAVTGRTASCVRGDTPVVTKYGVVEARSIRVGDTVFTHRYRWRSVTALFHKSPTLMFSLYLSNGEVLTVTLHHKVMLDSGLWAEVGSILERMGYANSQQETYEGSCSRAQCSDDVQARVSDGWGGSRQVWGKYCNGEKDDSFIYTGRSVQYSKGYEVQKIQTCGKESAIWKEMGLRLRGWEGISDSISGGEEIFRTPHRYGTVSGLAPIAVAEFGEYTSHRRESKEQQYQQSLFSDEGWASDNTRQVSVNRRGFTIEKVVCAGVHRVYDFEIAEDHSYLACGVFNHNSNPNGQNRPVRGQLAEAYKECYIAPDGYVIVAADLSQIELRIAAELANERTMLRIFREGGDIHETTALEVIGISKAVFDGMSKSERKQARFGAKACIAEGSLVLTRDRGEVPIENVCATDLVWDGIEWVEHEGVVYQGYKEVITYDGLTATKDHTVYTNYGPIQIGELASSFPKQRIAVGGDGALPIRFSYFDRKGGSKRRKGGQISGKIRRGGLFFLQQATSCLSSEHSDKEDDELQMPGQEEIFRSESKHIRREIRRHSAEVYRTEKRVVQELWGERSKAIIQIQRGVYPILSEVFTTHYIQKHTNRSRKQQWALREGESAFSYVRAEPTQQAYQSLGRILRQKSSVGRCVRRNTKRLSSLYFGESYGNKLCELEENKSALGRDTSTRRGISTANIGKTFAHVFDIVNAGSLHRFTVSGKVVANCNFGYIYGMWWKKFRRYAKTQYGVDYTDQESERLRTNYFRTYSGLDSWHKRVKSTVKRDGQVRSLTGRIRHLPAVESSEDYIVQEAERQGVNSPCQETASSLGVMATAAITNDIDEQYLAVFSFIHDAIYALVPEQYALWGARKLKAYMEFDYLKANFGYNKQVPIVSVPSIGFDMNNVVELEDLSPDGECDLAAKGLDLTVQDTPPDDGFRNTDAGIYSWTEEFHLNALNRSKNRV